MLKSLKNTYIAAVLVLLCCGVAFAYDGPTIVDDANLLAADELLELEHKIDQLNEKSQYFVVLLTTPSLGGQDVDKYSRAIMKVWKIGHAEKEDGLLVLLARDDKVVHFEIGPDASGLDEEFLEDLKNEVLLPSLESRSYVFGLTEFIAALEGGKKEVSIQTKIAYGILVLLVLIFIYANTLNRKSRKCPHCGKSISPSAGKCPECLTDVRVRPIDPCPCGSGRSYEACCLDDHLDGRESLRVQLLRYLDIRFLLAMSTAGGGFTAGGTGVLPKSGSRTGDFDGQSETGSW